MSIKAIRAIYKMNMSSVTSGEMLLLVYLADRLNDDYGYAFPSIVRIQHDLTRGKTWVHKNLNVLEQRGLIVRGKHYKKNSPPKNRYWLPFFPAAASEDDEEGPINEPKKSGSHSANAGGSHAPNVVDSHSANAVGAHGEGIKGTGKGKGKEQGKSHASACENPTTSDTTANASGEKVRNCPEEFKKGECPAARSANAAETTEHERALIEQVLSEQGYSEYRKADVERQVYIEWKAWKKECPDSPVTPDVAWKLVHRSDESIRDLFGETE